VLLMLMLVLESGGGSQVGTTALFDQSCSAPLSQPADNRAPNPTKPPGLNKNAIIERVARCRMRPNFPTGSHRWYVDLATACWAEDPTRRPSFNTIISALQNILHSISEPSG